MRKLENHFRFLIFIFYISSLTIVKAIESPQNLKEAINAKSQQLQEINQKISETEEDLDKAEGKGKTLEKEIKKIDQQVNQLNLGIRSGEINIEKLNLEIQSLDYDIRDARSLSVTKKSGVAQLLREIQKKDSETTITALLKWNTLSESLQELENLFNLNLGLSKEIGELKELDDQLSNKLTVVSGKKQRVESERENLKNRKSIVTSQKTERQKLLITTKNQEKLYAEQIAELKKLQLSVSAEVEKIEAELRAKIDPSLLPIPRPGVLAWPVTMKDQGGFGRLTQKWGLPSALYGGKSHNGIDIGAPIGTPVFAADSGKILEVWDQDKYCYKGAYGKFIIIEHQNNLTTLYAHLSFQSVAKGVFVERGQLIGYTGSTGYATGPHLHFTAYASPTFVIRTSKVNCGPIMPFGGDLDPLKYL